MKLQIFVLWTVLTATVLCHDMRNCSALDVRLETSGSAPRIFVDGKPIAPRMLRGKKTAPPVEIGTEPTEYSFDFVCTGDPKGKGTLHFKLEEKAYDLLLDNIKIVEIDSGRVVMGPYDFEDPATVLANWHIHPPQKINKAGKLGPNATRGKDRSGCMELISRKPQSGQWPRFFLIEHVHNLDLKPQKHYRLSFWAYSSVVTGPELNVYIPDSPYKNIGCINGTGDDPFATQLKLAAAAGTHLVASDIPFPWPTPGEPTDFTLVDQSIKHILGANPKALIVPWFCLDPPLWWLNAHPDHELKLLGSTNNIRYEKRSVSVSSELYRREVGEHLKNCIEYIEKKYGDHILGYMPCGQNTYEWFYQNVWGGGYPGYAPIDRIAWNEWLKQKYSTNETLQKAWQTDRWTLGNVDVPSIEFRKEANKSAFLDVAKGSEYRRLFDFHLFLQQMMSDTVLGVSRIAKETSNKLVFIFYGYYFELGGFSKGAATTGHMNLRPLLQSPWIDSLCAPMSYFNRNKGGVAPMMSPSESITLAGKLWLTEDDTRTHLIAPSTPKNPYDFLETLADTQSIHQRNLGQYLVRNFANWWVDLSSVGWLNDPGIWSNLNTLRPLDEYVQAHPIPFKPEIACFIDTDSLLASTNGSVSVQLCSLARAPLGLIGAPYGQYMLEDYLDGKTNAKVNILLAAWRLTSKQRQSLKEKAATDTIVWGFASGWLDAQHGGNTRNMEEIMPFKFRKIANPQKPPVLTEAGKAFGLKLVYQYEDMTASRFRQMKNNKSAKDQSLTYTVPEEIFTVTDARPDEILATLPDGSPIIVMRKTSSGGCSLYVGLPSLDKEILRGAAKIAGAHLYTTARPCVVYANKQMIVLHGSHQDGTIEINTGSQAEVWDYLAKQSLGNGPIVQVPLKWNETRILLLDPPKEILAK